MKKNQITLQILAKDIEETLYTNPSNCAMSRAIERAGLNNYDFHTNYLRHEEIKIDTRALDYKVRQMYAYKDKDLYPNNNKRVEEDYNVKELVIPHDFEYIINL